MGIVSGILNKVERKEKLNILCNCIHERYQSNLSSTGHQFYSYQAPNLKTWNTKFAPIPKNYVILNKDKGENQIPPWVDFDVVIAGNRFGSFQILATIAQKLGIPLIVVEHTTKHPDWPESYTRQISSMKGNINLYISEWSRREWLAEDYGQVLHHGIDTDVFKPKPEIPKKQYILTTVNQLKRPERAWCCGNSIWEQVTKDLPAINIGDDPPYSKAAESIEDLVRYHNEAYCYLNTSTFSPFPMSLFESMACGSVVVSLSNCMIPHVIQHGYNGLLTNDLNEMRGYLIDILNFPDKYKQLGVNARKTILERFTLQRFVDDWNKIFEQFK